MGQLFHHTIKLITVILLLSSSLWVYAASTRITMLISGESRLYYDAVDGVSEQLDDVDGLEYNILTISGFNNRSIQDINKNSDYIIAVGTKALRYISSVDTSVPVLNILVSKRNYQVIINKKQIAKKYSVIYLEQPTERLLLLTKLVSGERLKNIGMLFGPTSVSERADYVSAANKLSIQLVTQIAKSDKSSLDMIESLIKDSDAYIALYDRAVLNRKIAKWLLYMANVYRKPVIAYSKSYVEAGALAAVYTTPTEAGRSAGDWVIENIKNNKAKLWNRYPQRFTVNVNRRIATKLNLSIDDLDVITAKIKSAEVKR